MQEPERTGWTAAYYDRPVDRTGSLGDYDYEYGVEYAGILARFLALWLDHLIAFALSLPVAIPVALYYNHVAGDFAAVASFWLAWIAVDFAYQWFFTAIGGGLGKQLIGLRIVRERDRLPPATGTALLRVGFILLLGGIPVAGGLLAIADCAWAIGDDRRQAWHDRIAGTLVVKHQRQPG